jgi:hypothetical protein
MQRRQKQKQIDGHIQDEMAQKRFDFAHNKRDRILDGYVQHASEKDLCGNRSYERVFILVSKLHSPLAARQGNYIYKRELLGSLSVNHSRSD